VSTATKYQLYTFEEFCDLVPEGHKADLIDGVIYMASPDNIEHHRINKWLSWLLESFLMENELGGEIFGYRIAFRLNASNGPEPDLAYLKASGIHLARRGYIDGPPDWVVEIVSPESVERDHIKKRRLFEQAGVPEYWIIDPIRERLTCLRIGKGGSYRAIRPKKGSIGCQVIPGFWLRINWLWQKPLPAKKEVLAEIVGGAK
jgi:Uma2 family endonuclease